MSLARILKFLITAEIGFVLLSVGTGLWLADTLPEVLQQYLRAENDRESNSADLWKMVVYVAVLGLLIAGWIGLWNMKSWSRLVYTTAWGLSLIVVPLAGPSVMHGVESMLGDVATLIGGMNLSLVWFSKLSDQFPPLSNSLIPPTSQKRER